MQLYLQSVLQICYNEHQICWHTQTNLAIFFDRSAFFNWGVQLLDVAKSFNYFNRESIHRFRDSEFTTSASGSLVLFPNTGNPVLSMPIVAFPYVRFVTFVAPQQLFLWRANGISKPRWVRYIDLWECIGVSWVMRKGFVQSLIASWQQRKRISCSTLNIVFFFWGEVYSNICCLKIFVPWKYGGLDFFPKS